MAQQNLRTSLFFRPRSDIDFSSCRPSKPNHQHLGWQATSYRSPIQTRDNQTRRGFLFPFPLPQLYCYNPRRRQQARAWKPEGLQNSNTLRTIPSFFSRETVTVGAEPWAEQNSRQALVLCTDCLSVLGQPKVNPLPILSKGGRAGQNQYHYKLRHRHTRNIQALLALEASTLRAHSPHFINIMLTKTSNDNHGWWRHKLNLHRPRSLFSSWGCKQSGLVYK